MMSMRNWKGCTSMPTREQPSRRGSVQEAFVQVREIAHNVLCLASPGNPTQREYRAILEVSSTNYTLKSEEEQDLMIAGYRAFLKALAFPMQILVRSQELDLSPYVQHLEETAAQSAADPMWRDLADSHAQFVRELAARRTLLAHRFYLILPSDQGPGTRQPALAHLRPFGRERTRERIKAESLEKAQQQLDLRAEVVTQQLAAIGLHCRRLTGEELIALYYSCLTPERAIRYPLPALAVSGIGRPTRVRQRGQEVLSLEAHSPDEVHALSHHALLPASPIPQRATRKPQTQPEGAVPLPDLPHLADLLAPASVEVTRESMRLEDEYARGIAVTNFPREVSPGWHRCCCMTRSRRSCSMCIPRTTPPCCDNCCGARTSTSPHAASMNGAGAWKTRRCRWPNRMSMRSSASSRAAKSASLMWAST
jgi:hypothetical protein